VHELAVADRLLTEQLLFYDRTLDRPSNAYPGILFLAQLAQGHALRRLYRLLPPEEDFWGFYSRCHRATWRSVQEEWLLQCHAWGCASLSKCLSLASGKTSLLKVCTVALAFLAGREQEQAWICRVLDHHHAGLVLLDDLEDWKEDFLRGNFTFLLTRVLDRAGLRGKTERGARVELARLARCLYGRGEACRQLLRAEACFREAMKTPESSALPLWRELNRRYLQRCRIARQGIRAFRKRDRANVCASPAPGGGVPRPETGPKPMRVLLLPGVLPRHAVLAHRVAQRYRTRFPRFSPGEVVLVPGSLAPAPPPAQAVQIVCRTSILTPGGDDAPASDARIPLRVRVVLALTAAARRRLHGPGATLLEQVYTRGLALAVCGTLWPRRDEAPWLGLPAMVRLWCRNQEPYLWEKVGPFLETPCPPDVPVPGKPLPGGPLTGCPYPEGVLLYLGSRFHAYVRSHSLSPELAHEFRKKPSTLSREIRRYLVR